MFDGNFRSKRHVNLGGRSSRRTTTTTRAVPSRNFLSSTNNNNVTPGGGPTRKTNSNSNNVLEEARLLREQRAQKLQQQQSARIIQRYVRGTLSRKHLMEQLLAILNTTSGTINYLQASMLLSPIFASKLEDDDGGVERILQLSIHDTTITTVMSDLYKQRLWKARLQVVRRRQNQQGGGGTPLTATFQHVSVGASWFGKEQLLDLIQTLQQQQQHVEHSWLLTLRSVLDQQPALLDDKEVQAWLGATLLLLGRSASKEDDDMTNNQNNFNNDESKWLGSLANLLCPTPPDPSIMLVDGVEEKEAAKRTIVGLMLQEKELVVLRNLAFYATTSTTTTTPPATVLRLLEHVLLSSPNCHDLLLLMQLHIQGENLAELGKVTTTTTTSRQQPDGWSSSDDDDEDEDEIMMDASSISANKRKRSDPTRLSRIELSTMPKLDKLYKQQHVTARKEFIEQQQQHSSNNDQRREEMISLVNLWTSPALWNRWGLTVLLRGGDDNIAKSSYIRLLSSLIRHVSGLKPKATSSFLSHLAQEHGLLEGLWNNLLIVWTNGSSATTMDDQEFLICFCDLFAHHLIALRDNDFLRQYTVTSINQTAAAPAILAEHIIHHLKTCLYEMYWNVPVVRTDFDDVSSSNRGRAMLSCTKLWNSLYERWCRLVTRVPFVSEDQWWFPKPISRFEAGAVRSTNTNNTNRSYNRGENDDETEEADDALADAFADPKMARVLTCIPQALPFDRRVKLFDALLKADKERSQSTEALDGMLRRMMEDGGPVDLASVGRESVDIHRDALYSDSKKQLSTLGPRLKRRLNVTFINQHGQQEAGIDGGGIMKEFLDDLIRQAFDPSQYNKQDQQQDPIPHLFDVTPLQTLTVHYVPSYSKELLSHYEFLGRVLGKAVYESILVEPQFCLPFLNQLLGKQNSLEDLQNFDPEFHSNLMKLREMSSQEIASLGLTFELTMEQNHGRGRSVPLIPGGASIPVTKATVIQYTHLVAHFRLNVAASLPTRYFLRGFRDLIPASWVRLFSSYELQKLIGGDDEGLDVLALKRTMKYSAGYHPSQPIIQWFWEIVGEEWDAEMQRKFLKFMTSCSRQPLLGFDSLDPTPCIQQIRLHTTTKEEATSARLPTSSTCMNLLKLPCYSSKQVLRQKLEAAVESGAGFELT